MVIATFCRNRILRLYEGEEGQGKVALHISVVMFIIEDELQEGR